MQMLKDPVFDVFITGHAPFGALPQTMEMIFNDAETLCQVIDYPDDEEVLILFHLTVRDHVMIAHSLPIRRSVRLRTCMAPRTWSS